MKMKHAKKMNPINSIYCFLTVLVCSVCFFNACNNIAKKNIDSELKVDTIYFSNGGIKTICEYRNGKKNGWQLEFSSDLKLRRKLHFDDGVENGLNYSFFDNGKEESVGRWMKGKPFGDVTWFHENHKIEQYGCYDFQGHLRYREAYTNTQQLILREGKIVAQLLNDSNFDSLYANVPFSIHICVANPPLSKIQFCLLEYNPRGELIEQEELKAEDNVITLNKKMPDKGLYIQKIVGRLFDLEQNLVQTDTLESNFYIK